MEGIDIGATYGWWDGPATGDGPAADDRPAGDGPGDFDDGKLRGRRREDAPAI